MTHAAMIHAALHAEAEEDLDERLLGMAGRATIGAMTGAMLHALSSSVQAMQFSMAEIIARARDELVVDAEMAEDIQTIRSASESIIELFGAMRRLARASDGPPVAVPIGDLIEDALTLSRFMVHPSVRIDAETAAGEVSGHRSTLTQALVNLLVNAADAAPVGSAIRITVHTRPSDIEIRVRDEGSGVANELVPYMFEPFTGNKPRQTHAGLGLAFVAHTAAAHGGSVRYDAPTPERGASFVLSLPRVAAQPAFGG